MQYKTRLNVNLSDGSISIISESSKSSPLKLYHAISFLLPLLSSSFLRIYVWLCPSPTFHSS